MDVWSAHTERESEREMKAPSFSSTQRSMTSYFLQMNYSTTHLQDCSHAIINWELVIDEMFYKKS